MQWHLGAGRVVLALAAVVALVLAARDVLVAAPTPQLSAVYTAQAPPTSPDDPAWESAPVVEVPLTAQSAVAPALPQMSVSAARVRAIHDGQTIAFRVEWADQTRDALAVKPDQFRDAVALQFGVADTLPALCMGAPVGQANLWHWKADWQEDIDKGYQELPQVYPNFWKDYYPYLTSGTPPYNVAKDFTNDAAKAYLIGQAAGNPFSQTTRTSPVEELLASGFGTATHKTAQNVGGKGIWNNGTWQVVFTRPLTVQDQVSPAFAAGKNISVAVAVWNGSNREVGARKQVSNFITFAVSPTGLTPAPAGATTPPGATPKPGEPAPAAPPAPAAVTPLSITLPALGLLAITAVWILVLVYLLRPTATRR